MYVVETFSFANYLDFIFPPYFKSNCNISIAYDGATQTPVRVPVPVRERLAAGPRSIRRNYKLSIIIFRQR